MKKFLLIVSVLCLNILHAPCQKVTNVRAKQEGWNIAVYYDLQGIADIQLEMTINGAKRQIKSLYGDIGKRVKEGGNNKIIWNVLDDMGSTFDAEDVVFTVKASPAWRTFLLAEGAMSFSPLQGSGGFMVGRVARWGYYAKFRSSFMFAPSNGYFCPDDAYLNGYGSISVVELQSRFSGKKRNLELVVDIGAMYNMSQNTNFPVCIYWGGGFGMRRQMWEIDNHNWVQYSPSSHIGFSGDLGLLASFKGFTLDVGVNTINFQYMEVQLGLGWMFNK